MADTPLEKLRAIRNRILALISEHDLAAVRFRQNAAIGDLLAGIGTLWLEDEFSLPRTESRKAIARFRARWKESLDYRHLEAQTAQVTREVKELLGEAFARPPSLREVHKAVMVPTKLKRINMIVDRAIERLEQPARPRTRKRQTRKTSSRASSKTPVHKSESAKPWLQWLGAFAAFCTVMALSFALSVTWIEPLAAFLLSLGTSLTVVVILVLLSYWWTRRHP